MGTELQEVCVDESFDVPIHHGLHVRGLVVRAMVLDPLVVKNVGAYLGAPLNLLLGCLHLVLLLLTMT